MILHVSDIGIFDYSVLIISILAVFILINHINIARFILTK